MADFKIIIAGGGIAGLTLANMLEKFDVDYILLEAHSEIAPPVGASIGLFPNGLRILDQLGCYERIANLSVQHLDVAYMRDKKGDILCTVYQMFKHLEKRYVETYLADRFTYLSNIGTDMDMAYFFLIGRSFWRFYTTRSSTKIGYCSTKGSAI